jgi:hypothetical protein
MQSGCIWLAVGAGLFSLLQQVTHREPYLDGGLNAAISRLCTSDTLLPYNITYLNDVERRVERFLDKFPGLVFSEVSKQNLPAPKGEDICLLPVA